jgi:hypothetical protein
MNSSSQAMDGDVDVKKMSSHENAFPPIDPQFSSIPQPVAIQFSSLPQLYTQHLFLNTINANTPVKRDIILVELYECERFYPIFGWSSKLLPTDKLFHWCDKSYNKMPSKDELKLEKQWKWIDSTWECVVDESTSDGDGWCYSVDWDSKKLHNHKRIEYFFRRRLWQRRKEKLESNVAAQENKQIQQFFNRLELFKEDIKLEEGNDQIISLNYAEF